MSHYMAALLSGIFIDVLGVLCFHLTARNKAYSAAFVNTVLTGCILFVFIDVTRNVGLAVPYLLGIFIGGVIGVKLKAYLERKANR